jgi:O-antigen/teichoic acid export membrane protein
VFRNIFSNWAVTGLLILSGLILTPLMVFRLTPALYGVWIFLNGFLAYSDLLYLGMGPILVKQVAVFRQKNAQGELNTLVSTIFAFYCFMGGACLLLFICLSSVIANWVAGSIDTTQVTNAQMAFCALGAQLLCALMTSVFTGVLHGCGRFELSNITRASVTILRLILIVLVVGAQYGVLQLAVISFLTYLLGLLVHICLVCRVMPSLRIRLSFVRPAILRPSLALGIMSFLIVLSGKLIADTDILVIGAAIGPTAAAYYSVPAQMVAYAALFMAGITTVFMPYFARLYAAEDIAKIQDSFLGGSRLVCMASATLYASIIYLGPSFIGIWVGKDFEESSLFLLVTLGVSGFIRSILVQLPLALFQASGQLRGITIVVCAESATNLLASLILVQYVGAQGVALGTLLATLLCDVLLLPPLICRLARVSICRYVVQVIIPGIVVWVILSILYGLAAQGFPPNGLLPIVLHGLVGVSAAVAISAVWTSCLRQRQVF